MRQGPTRPRWPDIGGRIEAHPVLAQEPAEQGADRRQRTSQRAPAQAAPAFGGDKALHMIGGHGRPVVELVAFEEGTEAGQIAPVFAAGGGRGVTPVAEIIEEAVEVGLERHAGHWV